MNAPMIDSEMFLHRKPKVLIFEDDSTQAHQIEKDVIDLGCCVKISTNPFDAIDIGLTFNPDVTVFDIRVEKQYDSPIDGIIAFGLIKKHLPFVSPIFLTAFSKEKSYLQRASKYDPVVLSKPYIKNELKNNIFKRFFDSYDKKIESWGNIEKTFKQKGFDTDKFLNICDQVTQSSEYESELFKKIRNLFSLPNSSVVDEGLISILDKLADLTHQNPDFINKIVDVFGRELPELQNALMSKDVQSYINSKKYEAGAELVSNMIRDMVGYE